MQSDKGIGFLDLSEAKVYALHFSGWRRVSRSTVVVMAFFKLRRWHELIAAQFPFICPRTGTPGDAGSFLSCRFVGGSSWSDVVYIRLHRNAA